MFRCGEDLNNHVATEHPGLLVKKIPHECLCTKFATGKQLPEVAAAAGRDVRSSAARNRETLPSQKGEELVSFPRSLARLGSGWQYVGLKGWQSGSGWLLLGGHWIELGGRSAAGKPLVTQPDSHT